MADAYLAQSKRAEAARALQECAALPPVDGKTRLSVSEHCQFRAANLLLEDTHYQPALEAYRKLLEHFPASQYRERALLTMASIYHELGDASRFTETLTTLRDTTTQALWKTAAADALTDHTWRERFRERFMALQMSLPK
jgi:tetratricopeptide (TPR) repeat protein